MSKRIRQLEDAVQILQAHLSSEPHPLLAHELLDIKNVDEMDVAEKAHGKSEVEMYSDFGTLTISDQGVTHFVGRSGAEVNMCYSCEVVVFTNSIIGITRGKHAKNLRARMKQANPLRQRLW